MGERLPVSHRLARAAMLAAIVAAVTLLVLHWGQDAVDLARGWLTVVEGWSEPPSLW
jgi:hypothetical protein